MGNRSINSRTPGNAIKQSETSITSKRVNKNISAVQNDVEDNLEVPKKVTIVKKQKENIKKHIGPFNVSCMSSKKAEELMAEIQKSIKLNKLRHTLVL